MMKNLPIKTHNAVVSVVWLLFCIITPNAVQAKSYHKLMQGVAVGMDSVQVVEHVGSPTHWQTVERFFYLNDQVVIMDDEVIDIRVKDRIKPTHKNDKIAKRERPIAMLRIGMAKDEVLTTAGVPTSTEKGIDLYFSNRHRVELTDGQVRSVEMHIKKEMEILDWIRLNFSKGGLLFMNITLAFIMFGVALEIKLKHFREIIRKPKSALVGILSQFVALPALTFLLVLLIKPTPSVALGMILVAACPGGNISNFLSSLSKANIELSVSLTAFATLSAIVLTPLNFAFWGGLYSGTADMVIPIKIDVWEMMQTVFILLGIPIVVGTWFAHKFPKATQKIIKPLRWFSLVAFMGFILAAFASNFQFFLDYIHFILLIVFIHNLLALTTGFSLATLFGLPRPDRRTLTIETGIQNSGLGLVLIFNPNLFDGLGGMAFIAAWWGIWHILAGLGIASIFSRKPLQN
ncbi:MAG: bile acid:sodium symporter family protein [Tenuifilaceae bacterium]|nr:bile acid:sodium symporter family protein [Tenuifilaceae bacterium]